MVRGAREPRQGGVGSQPMMRKLMAAALVSLLLVCGLQAVEAKLPGQYREVLIPILGVTVEGEPIGTVVYLALAFVERDDHSGLSVHFTDRPGRFSSRSRAAVTHAIARVARSMGLSADSWSVEVRIPFSGVTIYGESLSAMVAVSAVALANGDEVAGDRVITGTVTADGRIGPVGFLPLKVRAAGEAHIRRVLVPEEQDPADADWQTPFLMQVSPVRSVEQAYDALVNVSQGG